MDMDLLKCLERASVLVAVVTDLVTGFGKDGVINASHGIREY